MPIFGKSSASPPEKEPPRQETGATYFGRNIRLSGELSGDEDIVFDGSLEGKVTLSKSLRVAPHGTVRAEISATVVVVAGTVVGNVEAAERVEILPTGILEGNVRAPKIVIAEGAKFKGSVDMGDRAESPPPQGPAGGR
jgi:cytoskeletal protein CcmA (bactofilin family)